MELIEKVNLSKRDICTKFDAAALEQAVWDLMTLVREEASFTAGRIIARRRHKDSRGETAPYTFLGPATYVTHQGERPMSMTWRLHHAMPAELFEEIKVAAG